MAMLLETFRKVKHLESQLEALGVESAAPAGTGVEFPALPSLVDLVSPTGSEQRAPVDASSSGVEYVDLQDVA